MLHMYLLVSLFSIFSMEPVNVLDINHQIDVEIEFSSIPQVNIGDPVLYKGAIVGNVSRVQPFSDDLSVNGRAVRVNVRLDSGSVPLGQGLVGLASSMKLSGSTGASARSFLDLMHLADVSASGGSSVLYKKNNADLLKGFSSFQEFWSTTKL